ncbi:hypothetical protein [Brevundimonas sp. NIBR11]|uniref:hypothetical protein n=1 Tax=Brevundimonas sp. NIBR11 TaxID=3015999 RepID=UPI0022F0FBC7|nr:hypothetical protein [Brevundimonas sp. NIBR11]WGM30575.1 hypothetical protein KKHFBJBL_00800 [Brevundimonas sp. NIBR11]
MLRRTFLTGTATAMAVGASGLVPALAAQAGAKDTATLALLTTAADGLAEAALAPSAGGGGYGGARGVLRQMRRLVTVFIWPQSRYFQSEALVQPIEDLLARVEAAQHDDGTFSGGNRHSPPDSSFLIEDMATVLGALKTSRQPIAEDMSARLIAMMKKAGPPLRTGGIHTPNHRWELSAALSKIDKVDPHPAYIARVDEWLAEGVDINAEGFYSEQSSNYAQAVSNPSLLRLANLPGREGLRALVRRNLEATIDLSEGFYGDVETILSRRQDQAQTKQTLHTYYLQFRELAQRDNDARFAGVVRWIERNDPSQLGDFLTDFMDQPSLAGPLPAPTNPFVDLQRKFETVNLVRERRGETTASFWAGSDWFVDGEPSEFYNRIGSGIATNPTLMRLWKGGLVIEAIRLTPNFFSMGHWRPSAVTVDEAGVVRLSGEMRVPYYLPMPAAQRNPDGAYALSRSVDGRFNSALDFSHRPAQFRVLSLGMTATPDGEGYLLTFEAGGEDEVEVSIEITLRDGGTLEGGVALEDGGVHLVDGQATYVAGDERLTVGPGNGNVPVMMSSGEQYSWARGQLALPGKRLYVTGRTPLRYDMRLAFG